MRAEAERAGREGAGRLETQALLFAALFPTLGTIFYFLVFSEGVVFRITYFGCKVIQFGFPLAWILLRRATRIGRGLAGPSSARWMAGGFVTGALMAAAIVAGYVLVFRGGAVATAAAGRVAERLAEMGASTLGRYALLAIFISIAHSWLEEYYWRWFLFGRLRPLAGAGPSVLLSSLAFTAHHVVVLWVYLGSGPAAWMVLPLAGGVALAGVIWARLYQRSGSILPGWISHVLADLSIMAVGWDLAAGAR